MSDTLYRYYARAEGKHIYRKSVCDTSCEFYECFNRATGEFGVYCDGTFYPRCWNPSLDPPNWQVTVPCCGGETVPGTCCGGGSTSMPKYLQVTFSGITNCGSGQPSAPAGLPCNSCEELNGNTYILEWSSSCNWVYGSGTLSVAVRLIGSSGVLILGAVNGTGNYTNCFGVDEYIGTGNICNLLPKSFDNENDNCVYNWRCTSIVGTATVSIP